MGRRTSDPHPESFLALGGVIEHRIACDQHLFPPTAPVEAFDERIASAIGEAETAYHAKRAREIRAEIAGAERRRLLEAGHAAAEFETPAGRHLIERVADTRALLMLANRKEPKPVVRDPDGSWRPPRTIVADVVAGVLFALPSARSGAAVEILNRGIPRRDQLQRVTESEVRNALHTFLRPGIADIEGKQRRAEAVAYRAAVIWRVWKRIEATPELRTLPKFAALGVIVADRRFYAWLLEAEESVQRPRLVSAHFDRLRRVASHLIKREMRRCGEDPDAANSNAETADVSRALGG